MNKYSLFLVFLLVGLLYAPSCSEAPKSGENVASRTMLEDSAYVEIGLGMAKSTQAELGKNLMAAMQREGALGALEFCNLQAYPLTDSMAMVHKAHIRRVSDRARNQSNQANELESAHIEHFKKLVAAGKEYEAIIEQRSGKVHFFYPITTSAMCLQCHGKPNIQIQPQTLAKIVELYPEDEAIGYDVNEVRGIWSIDFDEKPGS